VGDDDHALLDRVAALIVNPVTQTMETVTV
jgi:hypothetical protein